MKNTEMTQTKSCPRLSGKVSTERLTKGASVSRHERMKIRVSRNGKNSFYRTVLNTCLSFLNEVKNLAKDTGIKYGFCD